GFLPGEWGSGRMPAKAYLISCSEIFAFGNNFVTVRRRYSISSFEGTVFDGSPLSATSVVPTRIWSFQGRMKTGRPSAASVYRAAPGAPEKRGRTMCDPRTP